MPVAAFNIDSQLTNNNNKSTNKKSTGQSKSPMHQLPTNQSGVNSTINRQMSPSNFDPDMEEDNRLAPRAFNPVRTSVGTYKRQRNGQPEYSFGYSKKGLDYGNSQMPGAGQYENDVRVRPHEPNLISKVGRAPPVLNSNPGPGQHEMDVNPVRSRSPSYAMGRELKNTYMGKLSQNPGPGNYEHSPGFGQNQKAAFPMEARYDNFKDRVQNPGPGNYSPMSKNKQEANGNAFGGTRKGLQFPDNKSPGAGQYECITHMASPRVSSTFGKEQRVLYKITNKVPGPGQYEHDDNGHRTIRN